MKKCINAHQRACFDRMVAYWVDNPPGTPELAATGIGGMLEDIYEPRLAFWRELEPDTVIRVLQAYLPALDPDATLVWGDTFRDEVGNHLHVRQFDEYCAERLLAIPASERPSAPDRVYEWLMADFRARHEYENAAYLDSDFKAVRAIAGLIRRLEAAGVEPETTTRTGQAVTDPAPLATNGVHAN